MDSKKIIIIAGAVAIVAIIVILVVVLGNKKPQTAVNNIPVQNPVTSTTGTGTVNQVTPGPVAFGRAGFIVTTDSANPAALNLPRSKEPAPTTVSGTNFNNFNNAVSSGQIPNANGTYNQVATTNPFSFIQSNGVNYALPENQFLATYYPNASQDIAQSPGVSASSAPGQDPNDILVQPTAASQLPDNVALVPGVDSSLFQTSSDNSSAAILAYATAITNATAPADLIADSNLVITLPDASDPNQVNQEKATVQKIISDIKSITVPQSILGMSESYYLMYTQFSQLLDDQLAIINAKNQTAVTTAENAFQTDGTTFADTYKLVQLNAAVVKKQLSGQ